MCENCGCGEGEEGYRIMGHAGSSEHHHHVHGDHHHHHDGSHHKHEHGHEHEHSSGVHHHDHNEVKGETSKRIAMDTDILQRNNLLAERNRGYFEAKGIVSLNLVSSPGSGKTTLLEKTIKALSGKNISVIEGDQQTTLDAERIEATGVPVLQINTGNGCHLDAEMINKAVRQLDPANNSLLLIENVGNLVCPSLFDLGENKRVVIISVTEGEDKPLKYPNMFRTSQLCIINKTDLLPYLDFDMDKLKDYAKRVNPGIEFITLSARTGEGMEEWVKWMEGLV